MKIFLCDDDERQLEIYTEKLERLASKHNQKVELRCFKNGEEMLFHLEDHLSSVDAIYLDINMPKINGIQVAERIRSLEFVGEIIFLTVSQEHYLSAFDVNAFNYILKGDSDEKRFEDVFLKVVKCVATKEEEYLLLRGGGQSRKVELSSIHYFEIQRRIITVHYQDREFEFFSTLEKLENQLEKKGFIRVHRAFIVAVSAIDSITYESLQMVNGDVIPIGRTYKKSTQEYFKNRN